MKVTHEGKALAKVYCKVFMKSKGRDVFFRDGYTDMRGKFEYANTERVKEADKFAILVQSEQYGSLIKEVKTPGVGVNKSQRI